MCRIKGLRTWNGVRCAMLRADERLASPSKGGEKGRRQGALAWPIGGSRGQAETGPVEDRSGAAALVFGLVEAREGAQVAVSNSQAWRAMAATRRVAVGCGRGTCPRRA